MSKATVVYDGDCGICEASASWIIRHIPNIDVQSHRQFGVDELSSVWLIENNHKTTGAQAVAHILMRADSWYLRLFGRLFTFIGVRQVAACVYWLVARNRRHLSRLFGLKACGLPPR
ncbi:MAG: DCC1-like thiol-disulfide oxidoreductase family protein [Actinomycetes bacterium]|jgi:predicted DCC family thiol-disulfide oxidoreductase YuxK